MPITVDRAVETVDPEEVAELLSYSVAEPLVFADFECHTIYKEHERFTLIIGAVTQVAILIANN